VSAWVPVGRSILGRLFLFAQGVSSATEVVMKKAAEAAGGKIHAWYLTMGMYDAVIISEFPNDEASAKFMLSTAAMGNVTTKTLKAFTEGEYRKIVASL